MLNSPCFDISVNSQIEQKKLLCYDILVSSSTFGNCESIFEFHLPFDPDLERIKGGLPEPAKFPFPTNQGQGKSWEIRAGFLAVGRVNLDSFSPHVDFTLQCFDLASTSHT
jgi:hypothetical protein